MSSLQHVKSASAMFALHDNVYQMVVLHNSSTPCFGWLYIHTIACPWHRVLGTGQNGEGDCVMAA